MYFFNTEFYWRNKPVILFRSKIAQTKSVNSGLLTVCVSMYSSHPPFLSHDQQVPPAQGSMVMHMRPPTTGPFPNPIQRPVMQVNKPVIIRSPPYPNPGRDPPHSTPPSAPEPPVKGPEDGMKVSHPL